MIEIMSGARRIWIADEHALYRETMERDFDHYFGAVRSIAHPTFGEHVRVVDFTHTAEHWITGFTEFPIVCSSFAEPYATVQRYAELAELERGDCVWDLGAHVGVAALAFERAIQFEGRVIAVEPDPFNLLCLLKNLRGDDRNPTITIMPAAVNEFTGSIEFCADGTMGAAIAQIVHRRTPAMTVPCFSLRDLQIATKSTPDAIKMDIEGAELRVLRGAREFLQREHPLLIIEPHRVAGHWLTDAVIETLTTYGFACRLEAQPGHTTPLIVAIG